MGKSQFEGKLEVAQAAAGKPRGQREITVGGPLDIAARDEYDEHAIRVQFQIVQVPRGEHTEAAIKRVHGMGTEVVGEKRWSGTVELGELKIGRAETIKRDTRGVAIAVLERKGQFAFDTITWCDEIELKNARRGKAPPPKKPPGKAAPAKKPAGNAAPAKKPAGKAAPAKKPAGKAAPAKKPASKASRAKPAG